MNSYVVDPVKDTITDTVVETAGLEEVVDVYTDATGEAVKHGKKMEKMEKWFNNMFKD